MKPDVHVPELELRQFAQNVLCRGGVCAREAEVIAGILVWFEAVGRHTQGLARLAAYLERVRRGLIRSPCEAEFQQVGDTLWILDGKDGFGHYVADLAMGRAVESASRSGVGVVAVRRSNHFGAGSWFVHRAAASFQLGFAFSNAVPKVAATGGTSRVLGTNPIAFGAPLRDGQSVLVDLSTASSSGSGMTARAEEDSPIPAGIAVRRDGRPATTAQEAIEGTLLPFGGAKGYGLALMVEVLAGVISGAAVSEQVAPFEKNFERACNVGHFFIALDVLRWMDAESYYARMDRLVRVIKSSALMPGCGEVLLPGESRWREHQRSQAEGIRLEPRTLEGLRTVCAGLNLEVPW